MNFYDIKCSKCPPLADTHVCSRLPAIVFHSVANDFLR